MLKEIGKKKLVLIASAVVGLIVLIIIVLLLVHALSGSKKSYTIAENKLLEAAKEYYKENEKLLPQSVTEELSIDDVSLTSAGYLKDMNDLTPSGVTCSGKVVITYNGSNYRYTPLLDCGDDYKTKTLVSYIEANEPKVTSGVGLYDLNGESVFRGETPNNYVTFSGSTYRIVKITGGHVVLIYCDKLARISWDNRYNDDRNRSDGINDYSVSRLREYLEDAYKGTQLFTEEDKSLLASHQLYVGKRRESDAYNDGSIEKSEVIDNQFIGALPVYDYINASIDNNCNAVNTSSCINYNYLNAYRYNWWTITGNSDNTYMVYRVGTSGAIEKIRSSALGYVRPVIYLVSDAIYVSGDGTAENPYVIK